MAVNWRSEEELEWIRLQLEELLKANGHSVKISKIRVRQLIEICEQAEKTERAINGGRDE